MATTPEAIIASPPSRRPAELWLGGTVVALLVLAWFAGPGLDAHMNVDSIRDFIRVRDCSPAAQQAGRVCDLGTGTTAGRLIHGTLWMRLLVFAKYRLGISPATQAAAMSAATAAAAGVVFALIRPFGGRVLALGTASVFAALTGAVGFPEFTNGFIAFLPAAVFFLGLSRVVAGAGLRWYAVSGVALYPCIDAHVSSFVLVPVLLWVAASSARAAVPGVLVALGSLLAPALLLSAQTYALNFVADTALTCAFLGACAFVLILAHLVRAHWLRLAVEFRLGATACATILGCYGVGLVALAARPWPQNAYYLIPLLPPLAAVIAVATQAGLQMAPTLPEKLIMAAALCVAAWSSHPPFFLPLVEANIGLLCLAWGARHRGGRWLSWVALAGAGWVLSGPDGPGWWRPPPSAARVAVTIGLFLVGARSHFASEAASRRHRARGGASADQGNASVPARPGAALAAGVYAVLVTMLVARYGAWPNGRWAGEATIASAQALSAELRSRGWSCSQARLAQGLSVWTGDRRPPFECLLTESGPQQEPHDSQIVRIIPAPKAEAPKAGLPGWDSVELGHDRVALVSSITPWIRMDAGTGQVTRNGAPLAHFKIIPLWELEGRRDWEDVFNAEYPFVLNRLAPGLDAQTLAGATVRYDFPIQLTGADVQREVDLSNEAEPHAAWRIDGVAGPEHTLDASGLHVTLRRGGAAAGSISLVRIASGEHDTDDAPLELIETTPAETVIRNIFVRAGNPGNG